MRQCPFCGLQAKRFLPWGLDVPRLRETKTVGGGYRENARCPGCGSLDRERLVYLYLWWRSPLFQSRLWGHRVLHIAPELNLRRMIESKLGDEYITADLSRSDVAHNFDVEDIPFPEASFGLIICNHVLEHVPDDRRALSELYRVLTPGGIAILQVPIATKLQETYEDHGAMTEEERIAAHGQRDHVRLYGADYPERLHAAGFDLDVFRWRDDTSQFGGFRNRFALNRAETLFCVRKAGRGEVRARESTQRSLSSGLPSVRAVEPHEVSTEELILRLSDAEPCSWSVSRIPEEVIRFAVSPSVLDGTLGAALGKVGATLNKALLAGAGTRILLVDALERHEFQADTRTTEGVAAASSYPPVAAMLFADLRHLEKYSQVVVNEAKDATEALLGRRAGEIVSETVLKKVPAELKDASADLRRNLAITEGRVRVVSTGLTDSGSAALRHAVIYGNGNYNGASAVARIQPLCTTLTDQPYLPGICTGVDARHIVPPYPPLGASSTGDCWVAILRWCDPQSIIAHLPCAVKLQDRFVDPAIPDFGLMTHLVVRHAYNRSMLREGIGVFESIGQRLQDLGGLSPADWQETCYDIWLNHVGSVSRHLSLLLEQGRRIPRYRAQVIQDGRQALLDSTRSRQIWVPRELHEGYPMEEAAKRYQEYIGQYGELLQWWPQIWEQAAKMQEPTL